jgi:Protein of unknown function (DUF1186)
MESILSGRHFTICTKRDGDIKTTIGQPIGMVKIMDIQDILQKLEVNEGTFPREALVQAIAQREEIIPELLRVLAEAQHNIEHLRESEYMTHIYAMYLLAQFREPRAYPLIVEFFSIPGDIALDTTGDVATEDLAGVYGGPTLKNP